MSNLIKSLILILVPVVLFGQKNERALYRVSSSEVVFVSHAPQERITAVSTEAQGALDASVRTFACIIPVRSFHGFNSPLQREHFNENYLESDEYPNVAFKGRIIEGVDLGATGAHEVRAKGILSVHGVDQERIIICKLIIEEDRIKIVSSFKVQLVDHHINVPRIVQMKIAPVIDVNILMDLTIPNKER